MNSLRALKVVTILSASFVISSPAIAGGLTCDLGQDLCADILKVQSDSKYTKYRTLKEKLEAYWSTLKGADQQEPTAPTSDPAKKPPGGSGPSTANATQATATQATAPAAAKTAPALPGETATSFYLRQNFPDVGVAALPNSTGGSNGASISYSNDTVAKNSLWNAQGLAVLNFSTYWGNQKNNPFYLRYLDFGAYGGLTKIENSNPKNVSKKVSNEQLGVYLETDLQSRDDYYNWFRMRAGDVRDDIAKSSLFNTTAEWIPVYEPLYVHRPYFFDWGAGRFGVRFDAEVEAQYDHRFEGASPIAFSGGPNSFRLGPQLGLWLRPFFGVTYLQNFYAITTYHTYRELYSGRDEHYFQQSLNYSLNSDDTFSLSGSYQQGLDENTGAALNLFKLGLAGKF